MPIVGLQLSHCCRSLFHFLYDVDGASSLCVVVGGVSCEGGLSWVSVVLGAGVSGLVEVNVGVTESGFERLGAGRAYFCCKVFSWERYSWSKALRSASCSFQN